MRSAAILLLAASAAAYPDMARVLAERELVTRQTVPFPKIGGIPRPPGSVPFDAAAQFVDVSPGSANEYRAPRTGDIRGPCAGLNAAANHGFLSRDGIATYADVETGLFKAFGLGQSATQVLQQTTAFFTGDPITQRWSIGGYSPKTAVAGGLLSILGQESGIGNYGHLKSEGDASITRGDFYAPTMNSNEDSYPQFFQELLDTSCAMNSDCSITMASLAAHSDKRKSHSIATNPNYFSPVFAGVAFTPAAHHFVSALMSNQSAEHPEGLLTPETLMSFFGYTGKSGALKWNRGTERIPANWYKRAITNPWTMPDILVGVGQQCAAYPGNCRVGGNTGTVNSFAGVDAGDISGGLFNSSVYTDPSQFGCMLSQNIQAEAPSFLSNVFQGPQLTAAIALIATSLVPTLAAGFGFCNGINGGLQASGATNGQQGVPLAIYGKSFPGAQVTNSGPRAVSPSF